MNYSALRQFHDDLMAQASQLCPGAMLSDLDLHGHRGKFRQAIVGALGEHVKLGAVIAFSKNGRIEDPILRSFPFWLTVRERFLELGGDYMEGKRPGR